MYDFPHLRERRQEVVERGDGEAGGGEKVASDDGDDARNSPPRAH